ncbi:hypothetical protein FACS1894208_08540 [Clostridia bacterium]|nr:hypothetical protein FACS1894208_08540 [Clostridia bacterium]
MRRIALIALAVLMLPIFSACSKEPAADPTPASYSPGDTFTVRLTGPDRKTLRCDIIFELKHAPKEEAAGGHEATAEAGAMSIEEAKIRNAIIKVLVTLSQDDVIDPNLETLQVTVVEACNAALGEEKFASALFTTFQSS